MFLQEERSERVVFLLGLRGWGQLAGRFDVLEVDGARHLLLNVSAYFERFYLRRITLISNVKCARRLVGDTLSILFGVVVVGQNFYLHFIEGPVGSPDLFWQPSRSIASRIWRL